MFRYLILSLMVVFTTGCNDSPEGKEKTSTVAEKRDVAVSTSTGNEELGNRRDVSTSNVDESVAKQKVEVDGGGSKDVMPLPSLKAGWSFSNIDQESVDADSQVTLSDNSSRYGVADYVISEIISGKRLGVVMTIKKNNQQGNAIIMRIQYKDGQVNNCSFNTLSGKHMVWGKGGAKPVAGVSDLGMIGNFHV